MKIIRGRLNPADVSNPAFRYDATCDCIQQTPDGGTTWVDVPSADPRHAVGFLKPPVAGSNKQCDAAANMVKWIKDFIDYETALMVAGATITTLVNSILTPMDLLFPAADFLSLIIDVADTIFGIGAAGLTTAFTSDQYDLLLCIFECNDDSDGRVIAAQLGVIEGQITEQLNTTAALVVNAILFIQGEVGLSNAGAIGSEVGDCSGCDCGWCFADDLSADDGGFVPTTGDGQDMSVYSAGVGWQGVCFPHEGTFQLCFIERLFGSSVQLRSVEFHLDVIAGTDIGALPFAIQGTLAGSVVFTASTAAHGGSDIALSWTGNDIVDRVQLVTYSSRTDCSGQVTVKDVRWSGLGDNPFSESNC